MQRVLITSLRFSGQAEVIYNADGVLTKIDATNCRMDAHNMALLKARTPSHFDKFNDGWKDMDAIAMTADFEVSLTDFIREYDYNRNTHLLQPIWDKMSKADQVQAVQEATEYRKYRERNKGWYKSKIAATWLKEKQYLNKWKNL